MPMYMYTCVEVTAQHKLQLVPSYGERSKDDTQVVNLSLRSRHLGKYKGYSLWADTYRATRREYYFYAVTKNTEL